MAEVPSKQLTDAALAVLERDYGVNVANLSHLATHSNVLYRADLTDGRRRVLRVSRPKSNTRTNIDLEVSWLSELADDPRLNVTSPVPTPSGRLVVDFDSPDGPRHCVLFSWVPGEPVGEGAGTSGYRAMGRVAALLHHHGGWRPSDPSLLRRWDRTFYYPETLDPVVIDEYRYDHLFEGMRVPLRRAADMADALIARAWTAAEPMVVHGDLHEWNVHLYMGRAWVIDFEDLMLALPAQDIATSLYGARMRPDLDALISAFRTGYDEHRPWPVAGRAELELYWAARQVMLMNHAAQILTNPEARDYFDKVMPWLLSYLDRAG
ncbi:MAG: phosphotransferase enzyme family protein [Acidimicrobiia bacterium]